MRVFNEHAKSLIATLGAVGVALQTQFPGNHWAEFGTAIVTAFLVYFVPNTTSTKEATKSVQSVDSHGQF
jgi:hypothetical protein